MISDLRMRGRALRIVAVSLCPILRHASVQRDQRGVVTIATTSSHQAAEEGGTKNL